jgi:hypothetical protein
VIAMTMPVTTNTTIATCIQIHVGDTTSEDTARALGYRRAPSPAASIV